MKKLLIVMICLILATNTAFSLACIDLSTGGTKDLTLTQGTTTQINLRLYNVSAEKKICDPAIYGEKIELIQPKTNIDNYFIYSFSENNYLLQNGENKQLQLNLTPKATGQYKILVTAIRNPNASIGTQIIQTASATINITVQNNSTGNTVYSTNTTITPNQTTPNPQTTTPTITNTPQPITSQPNNPTENSTITEAKNTMQEMIDQNFAWGGFTKDLLPKQIETLATTILMIVLTITGLTILVIKKRSNPKKVIANA